MNPVTRLLRRLRPGAARDSGPMPAELWETARSVIVRIELPGIREEDFKVSVADNVLHIRGEKHAEAHDASRRYHFMERVFGRFERSILLPGTPLAGVEETSCRDGVLTVIVRKAEPIPPRPG